jgi:FKBP-type peptidyl-prolyl cis-trans isomerase FkpA
MRFAPLVLAAMALGACSAPSSNQPQSTSTTAASETAALQTDQDKTLYALGLAIGGNVREFQLTEAELGVVAEGMADAVLGREAKVDLQTWGPRIQGLVQERAAAAAGAEKSAADAFVAEQARQPGAEQLASGVVFIPVTEGTGETPTAESTVRVHYHGTLRDGSVFDSSVQRGEPISFPLSGVIPCWTEGVQKIKVGGKAKLVCPSSTAYGDQGSGSIPGGAALMFEVELLAIE